MIGIISGAVQGSPKSPANVQKFICLTKHIGKSFLNRSKEYDSSVILGFRLGLKLLYLGHQGQIELQRVDT